MNRSHMPATVVKFCPQAACMQGRQSIHSINPWLMQGGLVDTCSLAYHLRWT